MSRTFRVSPYDWPSGKWYQEYIQGRKRARTRDLIQTEQYERIYDYPLYEKWESPKEQRFWLQYQNPYKGPCHCNRWYYQRLGEICSDCIRRADYLQNLLRQRRILARQKDRAFSLFLEDTA